LSSILYYITGHGFGHAVRSHQVVRALKSRRPELRVCVRTTAPDWLFANPPGAMHYSREAIDVGILQADSLEMDREKTLRACQKLLGAAPQIIEREVAFVHANQIRLILGDIPPLCFEIAARANLPSVGITNFTWDVIYGAYLSNFPGFRPPVERMTEWYSKASLALTLPYPCDMRMFPSVEPIPWIARTSSLTRAQARSKFGLPESATIVLTSFGGLGLERLPWGRIKQSTDFFFVATGKDHCSEGNLLVLPDTQIHYEDLIRAADAIVTKPGYGIVADVIAQRVPILYTDRGDFDEYPRLVEALRECATAEFIPQAELLAGNVEPYLTELFSRDGHWPSVRLDGAQAAAERVLALLDDQP
jgi:UDP:flavonoid glycosyltransferase YjiC (YdhE family)